MAIQTTIYADFGDTPNTHFKNRHGDSKVKAQVVSYGEFGKAGLNIQIMWQDSDGTEKYGKRPLLTIEMLEWIKENDIIEKAISVLVDIANKTK